MNSYIKSKSMFYHHMKMIRGKKKETTVQNLGIFMKNRLHKVEKIRNKIGIKKGKISETQIVAF